MSRNKIIANFLCFDPHIKCVLKQLNQEKNEENELNVMNMFIDISTESLARIFHTLTTNLGVEEEFKPIINMKNEFVISDLLTTQSKKHYVSRTTAEFGKPFPEPDIDSKGLQTRKSVVPAKLRTIYNSMNERLLSGELTITQLMKEFDDSAKMIRDSLERGELEFLKPVNVKEVNGYATPQSIPACRGMLIWNEFKTDFPVVPGDPAGVLKLKGFENENDPRMLDMKEKYPVQYKALYDIFIAKTKVFPYTVTTEFGKEELMVDVAKYGFMSVTMPSDMEEIPDFIRPFIDYDQMVSDHTSAYFEILEAVGVHCAKVKVGKDRELNFKTNILRI